MEAIVLLRPTQQHIPEDGILMSEAILNSVSSLKEELITSAVQ
jgi:hypothetical protein